MKQQFALYCGVVKNQGGLKRCPVFPHLFVHHIFSLIGYWRPVQHCRVRHWVSKQVAHSRTPLHFVWGCPHVVTWGVVSLIVHCLWCRTGVFKENRICGGGSCASSRFSWVKTRNVTWVYFYRCRHIIKLKNDGLSDVLSGHFSDLLRFLNISTLYYRKCCRPTIRNFTSIC